MASQITSLTIVFSNVYSGTDQRKHQSNASLAFVRGIHRRSVNFPHKGPVTRKYFHLMTSSWQDPSWGCGGRIWKQTFFRFLQLAVTEELEIGSGLLVHFSAITFRPHINGLVQERRNSSAFEMKLRVTCTKTSIYLDISHSCFLQHQIISKFLLWLRNLFPESLQTYAKREHSNAWFNV